MTGAVTRERGDAGNHGDRGERGAGGGSVGGPADLSLRHATAADWPAMADAVNRARRADGVDEVRTAANLAAEYGESETFRIARDVLIAERGGAFVGFTIGYRVARDGVLVGESWGVVVPEHRRQGIGTALFRATRDRLAAECAADDRPGPRELRSYALDQETADRALLAAQGFVPIRYGFEMRRFLAGALPERALPDGLEIRPVTEDQHRRIFQADDEAFGDHWGHRDQDETDFALRFHGPDADTSLWCVAWAGEEVAGVVENVIYREENEELGVRRGWLEHVSVRRPWRGQGVAKALCAASFRVLRDRGMDEAWLGVDGSNPTGAVQLYEGLGFGVVRRWQAYGRPLAGPAPMGWRSASDRTDGGP
jgi:mycothiol synthase